MKNQWEKKSLSWYLFIGSFYCSSFRRVLIAEFKTKRNYLRIVVEEAKVKKNTKATNGNVVRFSIIEVNALKKFVVNFCWYLSA